MLQGLLYRDPPAGVKLKHPVQQIQSIWVGLWEDVADVLALQGQTTLASRSLPSSIPNPMALLPSD